jgi:hypothetical protein
MPKLYSFDVDETLEISNGPIKLNELVALRNEGHIVGICGNWGLFVKVPGWQHIASFVNCCLVVQDQLGNVHGDKGWFLAELRKYIPAEEYIHVGNIFGRVNKLGVSCGSHDDVAAAQAGWRFILEDHFSDGVR